MSSEYCQILFRKEGKLSFCGNKKEQYHFLNCTPCQEKVKLKWEECRERDEFWKPSIGGRGQTVFDVDKNKFDIVTFEEFKKLKLEYHKHSEFILNYPQIPGQHWDQDSQDFFTVYVIRCKDNSFYVGQTSLDHLERLKQHKSNTSATSNFIKKHGGVDELVSVQYTRTRQSALELEKSLASVLASIGHVVNVV